MKTEKKLELNTILNNSKGMTITNIMVALGMAGILMLVLSQLLDNSSNSQRYALQKQEAFTQYLSATDLLSDRSACESNFKDKKIDGTETLSMVKLNAASPPILAVNAKYGDGLIKLTRLELNNFKPYSGGGTRGTGELILEFKGLGRGLSGRSFGKVVLLSVETDGAGLVQTCVAIGNDLDDIWQRNNVGELYYTGTYVGIGTDQPEEMLHVNGNILAEAFLHDSDIRLKKDISEIKIEKSIEQIKGVYFSWKKSGKRSIGVIAQDVEKVFPEAVHTDLKSGTKRVAYDLLVAPLIQYNKFLNEKIKILEAKQTRIEKGLRKLKNNCQE